MNVGRMKVGKNLGGGILLCVLLFLYAFILTVSNSSYPKSAAIDSVDSAVYQYMGHLVSVGKMPYKDAFDHKGPILYFLVAIGERISPNYGEYCVELLSMVAILAFSYLFLRRFAKKLPSLFLCGFMYSFLSRYYVWHNGPDYFQLLFNMAALYLLSDYYTLGKISARRTVIIGLLTGGVFWLKQTLTVEILFLCFCILVDCAIQRRFQDILHYIAFFMAGFLPISLAVCGWMFLGGAWGDFIKDYFMFNFVYSSSTFDGRPVLFSNRVKAFLYLAASKHAMMVWALLCIYILVRAFQCEFRYKSGDAQRSGVELERERRDVIVLHFTLALVVNFIVHALPSYRFDQYQLDCIPALLAVAAVTTQGILSADSRVLNVLYVMFACFGLAAFVIPNLQRVPKNCSARWKRNLEQQQIVEDILQYSADGDVILAVSNRDSGYYLATGRGAASQYFWVPESLRWDDGFLNEYSDEIKREKPPVILWKTSFMDSEHNFFKNGALDDYALADTTENHRIYALKERLDAPIADASP